jgi:hypothetical protein
MARRSIPNPQPFASHDSRDRARESQGPGFEAQFGDVRQRAAQWDATAALLAEAVASHPAAHATAEPHARVPRQPTPSHRTFRAPRARNHPNNGAADKASNESWQYRQLELLERIDDNIRRLRELQESARTPQSTFTEPAY